MIVNVYTEPDHRGKGLARQIMEALLRATEERGIQFVTLNASDQGRSLYEKLGFPY